MLTLFECIEIIFSIPLKYNLTSPVGFISKVTFPSASVIPDVSAFDTDPTNTPANGFLNSSNTVTFTLPVWALTLNGDNSRIKKKIFTENANIFKLLNSKKPVALEQGKSLFM